MKPDINNEVGFVSKAISLQVHCTNN